MNQTPYNVALKLGVQAWLVLDFLSKNGSARGLHDELSDRDVTLLYGRWGREGRHSEAAEYVQDHVLKLNPEDPLTKSDYQKIVRDFLDKNNLMLVDKAVHTRMAHTIRK